MVLKLQSVHHLLPADPDEELSDHSPAPCLPVCLWAAASHHDETILNL